MHWIVLADVIADVGGPADVNLAGGQEDVHADVDQQPALDLAGDDAGDHVAFVDGFDDLHPGLDFFGLALAQSDHAAGVVDEPVDVFHVLDQHFDYCAGFGQLFAFLPLAAENDSFAFISHIDEHYVAFHAQDPALHDLIEVHLLSSPVEVLGLVALHSVVKLALPIFF